MEELDIKEMETAVDGVTKGKAESVETVSRLAKKYQASPAAMDGTLAKVLPTLLDAASPLLNDGDIDLLCEACYELCSARGMKRAVRWFPHAVRDVTGVFGKLREDGGPWKTRYTLFLWLAMLLKNPFDVASVVSDGAFVDDVYDRCRSALGDSGPTREAAALCFSAVLTRKDIPSTYLERLVSETKHLVENQILHDDGTFAAAGALRTVSIALKVGDRTRCRHVALGCLEATQPCFPEEDEEAPPQARPLRKLAVKVVGRVGQYALLKPKIRSWCYARGRRTLLIEDHSGRTAVQEEKQEEDDDEEDDEEDEMGSLEEVVDRLLTATKDPETQTRWAAAKAVGRVAARLARRTADDVVSCVCEQATDDTDENGRHGAVLALAELARLGVLLPERLEDASKALTTSMIFEDRNAQGAPVGAHVRDAACYAAWAFARAYDPVLVKPHLPTLTGTMIVVALFDREVHVRRAASAALQENVGRQGHENFPNGIELLRLGDFFALGNRDKAYLDVAPKVADLDDSYLQAIADRLLQDRLCHWDPAIRVVAAKALGGLVKKPPRKELAERALKELRPRCFTEGAIDHRHGALLGLAAVLTSSEEEEDGPRLAEAFSLGDVVPELEAMRLYRGRGGDLVRVAACDLIAALASINAALPVKTQVRLLDSIDESAVHALDDVRDASLKALRLLTGAYFGGGGDKGPPSERLLARTADKYVDLLKKAPSASASRGLARCLGALPRRILDARLKEVVGILTKRASRDDKVAGDRDAETRKAAIFGLNDIVRSQIQRRTNREFFVRARIQNERLSALIFRTFIDACRDYGADKRGDVGSWVRTAAMQSLVPFAFGAAEASGVPRPPKKAQVKTDPLKLMVPGEEERFKMAQAYMANPDRMFLDSWDDETENIAWTPDMSQALVGVVLRQLGEKLDVVRESAKKVLSKAITDVAILPSRPALAALIEEEDIFPGLAALLIAAPVYAAPILGGLLVTAGSSDSYAADKAMSALLATVKHASTQRDLRSVALILRVLTTIVEDVCLTSSSPQYKGPTTTQLVQSTDTTSGEYLDMSTEEPPLHLVIAEASFVSKEEAARAYVPALRCLGAILDNGTARVLYEPPPGDDVERTRRALERVGLPADMEELAMGKTREDPDDRDSLFSKVVATLARIAASKRAGFDLKRTNTTVDALLSAVSLADLAPENIRKAIAAVIAHLASPMPRARAYVAEQLYARLVDLAHVKQGPFDVDRLRQARDRLAAINWDGGGSLSPPPLTEYRGHRDALANDLDISSQLSRVAAILDKRSSNTPSTTKPDDLESYAALVKDAGY